MAHVQRKDPYLDEAVQLLEPFYERAKGDPIAAYAALSQPLKDFVDTEIERCLDVRYYLENYHVINTKTEGFKTLYPFWDSQEIFIDKIYYLVIEGKLVKVVVLKARQLGLSTISEGILFWKTIFTPGCNSLVVAQEQKQADYLFDMGRLAYDYLPWWMKPEIRYDAKGRYLMFDRSDPIIRMSNPGLRSQILVDYANKLSGLAGVGKTIHACHISEYSSFADPGVLTEGIFPTMTSNSLAIVESTARGRNNSFHEFWKNAVEGDSDWIPVFIESYRIKDYYLPIEPKEVFTLTNEELGIKIKIKADVGVDVKDEHFKWRRARIKEYTDIQGEEGEAMFFQEYPSVSWHEAFQGSGLCAFNKKRLHEIQETTCKRPYAYGEIELKEDHKTPSLRLVKVEPHKDIPYQKEYGGRLYIWEMPEEGETYYIGADVAHGHKGGDFSAAPIIRIGHPGEPDVQVAEWHGWISPTPFGCVLAALGYFYNEAQIAVECNDVGILTDQVLFRELDYPNVFRWKHYDKIKNFQSDFLGWYTNSKTRDMIIAKLREAIDDHTLVIRSTETIEELIDFAQEEVGARFEGQSGNDDRAMSLMICRFCAHDSDYGQQAASAPRMTPEEKKRTDYVNTDFAPAYESKSRAGNNRDNVFFGNPVLENLNQVRLDRNLVDPWHPSEGGNWISGVDGNFGSPVPLDELWKLL